MESLASLTTLGTAVAGDAWEAISRHLVVPLEELLMPPKKRPPTAVEMAAIARRPERMRNVCVLGHIDHGKSSLVDWLVAENGIIPNRLAGQLRYMDDHPDEQERGITMRASAISLIFAHKGPKPAREKDNAGDDRYLMTIVDSPGHIDFAYDVEAAARVCKGCLVIVDVVEGLRPQTNTALKFVKTSKLAPVLILNKIDRLAAGETKISPGEACERLFRIVELANAKTDGAFGLEKGNVLLTSAKHGWGASLIQVARHLSISANKDKVVATLAASDIAYTSGKFVRRVGKHADADAALAALFLGPFVWTAYDEDRIDQLRGQFPLARAVLKAIVETVPPPLPSSDDGALAIVSKVFAPSSSFDSLYGFGYVTGTKAVEVGARLYVLTDEDSTPLEVEISHLYAMMGASLAPIDTAEPGRVFAFGPEVPIAMGCAKRGIATESINTDATSVLYQPSLASQPPFLKVAVSAASRSDEVALDRGLALLRQLDAAATVEIGDRGDRILGCVGELHLDQCLRDLTERYARVQVRASPPAVDLREGLMHDPPKHAAFPPPQAVTLPPWRNEVTQNPDLHLLAPGVARLALRSDGETSLVDVEVAATPLRDFDDAAVRIETGSCVLASAEPVDASVVAGFKLAADAGPLAEEPLHRVRFELRHFAKANDASPGAVMTTTKKCCRAALLASPGLRLVEPYLDCELRCADPDQVGKMYALVHKRRGNVVEEQYDDQSDFVATISLPALEAIGFANELLHWTSGAATLSSMRFDEYKLEPEDPFWQPTTLDEREEHGEDLAKHNRPRKLINAVRDRKGLRTELLVVQDDAEKIRS